jgi:multicomponent K+:H+ antiporter subunit F
VNLVEAVLPWVTGAFSLALALNAWRLFVGPGLPDRILALDTLYVNALALIVVLGVQWADRVYFELALLIGLLGFVGTVALGKYLMRGDIVE